MYCHSLFSEDCPCTLAELAKCKYCTLLQGKELCDCSWQNICAYDRFLWHDISYPNYPPDTLVSVISYQNSLGIIIKPNAALVQSQIGSNLEIKLDYPFALTIRGVVLRSYPEHGLIYLFSSDKYPKELLCQQNINIRVTGNAILGHHLINTTEKHIAIVADRQLSEPAHELAGAIEAKGNKVSLLFDIKSSIAQVLTAQILLLIGTDSYVKWAVKQLPQSYRGQIACWLL